VDVSWGSRETLHTWRADNGLRARYSTMDNVDGKQARRTGQSSGLGELFECVWNVLGRKGANLQLATELIL